MANLLHAEVNGTARASCSTTLFFCKKRTTLSALFALSQMKAVKNRETFCFQGLQLL